MKYKHIFFDLDNTLWDFDANSAETLSDLYKEFQLQQYFADFQSFYTIYKAKNEELWAKYSAGELDKKSLHYQRFEYPFISTNFNQIQALADAYLSVLKTKTHLKPFAKEMLIYLKQKDYSLYIVSNGFTEVQYHKMNNSGITDFFDRIFLSEAVKEHKPSKLFFDYAITSTNARKVESLVIGDNWEADIFGAKNAGIDQVYYNVQQQTVLSFEPTYQIVCLSELKAIL